jgi:thioredoxin-like negative regulator of GroEL
MQRAGALLSSQQWDAARNSAWLAWRWGAPDDSVLEVLGVISLATHHPNAGSTALVMAHTTARPSSLALAGALLLESSCPQEAIPILRTAVQYLRRSDPKKASEARMLLADALILSGQLENATEVLGQLTEAQLPPEQAGILRARNRLLTLLRMTPDKWASMIPGLNAQRHGRTTESAESLFLLGQVQEWLGDDQAAIDTYLTMVDHHRGLAAGEPARRLVEVWSKRTHRLLEDGEAMRAVELHAAVWRPSLSDLVRDPAPLLPLAAAYRDIGLQHRAMNILGLAAEVEGRNQLDDQETVLQIADLYLDMGHPDLASDALEVLRTRTLSPSVSGKALLLEGRIADHQGDTLVALQHWNAAAQIPDTAVEARARIAMVEAAAGNCTPALEPLATALDDLSVKKRLGEGVMRSFYAHCLGTTGNAEGSAVAAFQAASSLHDPSSSRFASWLSASSARTASVPPPGPPLESDPPDIWTLLSREDQQQSEFDEKLAALQH